MDQDSHEHPHPPRGLRFLIEQRVGRWELLRLLAPIAVLSVAAVWLTVHYTHAAPPRTLSMATGPAGSTFATMGGRYQKILARSGITLRLVPSAGSLDNLARLNARNSGVDVAFVQSGVVVDPATTELVSLGSMFYEPLMVFYRAPHAATRLSELKGLRIAIGVEGSGARYLALALLKANGIEPGGATTLSNLEGDEARKALLGGRVDAIFLTGDSASPETLRVMLHADGIRLFDFAQAEAYARRFPYLSRLSVPAGAFDLGENLPQAPMTLLAPTVEIIARRGLHPALSDLLIEAAGEIHGHASILHEAGAFPASAAHDFPLSADAARYYKSGKTFTYRYLPFWLASLLNRLLVYVVPVLLIVIPGLRYLPFLYNWRIRSRIHRRYVQLMALERRALGERSPEERAALLEKLADIEHAVIKVRVPGSHADQLYVLRQHIQFVREQLNEGQPRPARSIARAAVPDSWPP